MYLRPDGAEIPIIGCDKHPEVPVTVNFLTTKGGYSSFSVKYIIIREFTENQKVLFDPIYMKFCHTLNPPELCIYTKDRIVEVIQSRPKIQARETKSVISGHQ